MTRAKTQKTVASSLHDPAKAIMYTQVFPFSGSFPKALPAHISCLPIWCHLESLRPSSLREIRTEADESINPFQMTDPEKPPLFKTWSGWYLLVLSVLVLQIIIYRIVTLAFS